MNRKWYIDEIYDATVIRLTIFLGAVFRGIDKLVVDGILHGIAWVTYGISQVIRWVGDELIINGGFDTGCEGVRSFGQVMARLQNGRVQNYIRVMSLGAAVLVLLYYII